MITQLNSRAKLQGKTKKKASSHPQKTPRSTYRITQKVGRGGGGGCDQANLQQIRTIYTFSSPWELAKGVASRARYGGGDVEARGDPKLAGPETHSE